MFFFFGLGNPGQKYWLTRHNLGFRVIDAFIHHLGDKQLTPINQHNSVFFKTQIFQRELFLIKPLCYMNLSGEVILTFMTKFKMKKKKILIIYDDLDLEFGKIKFKTNGSSAGHKGVKSIINNIGSDFNRMKLGIGNPSLAKKKSEQFVLEKFSPQEEKEIPGYLQFILQALTCFLNKGLEKSMSIYNNQSYET